jgi:hypothetical protein
MDVSLKKGFWGAAVATGLMLTGTAANAVTHSGGEFTVSGTSVDEDTATFVYTADFTNWTGPGNYIFAIDFGLSDPKVASIDSFSTTADGNWEASLGPSNASGCQDASEVFACADDVPFDPATGQETSGIVTWTFTITFDDIVSVADWTDSDNHIGAFFKQCDIATSGPNEGELVCRSTNGLSEETTFGDDDDDDDDTDVPEPGTLALLGLGLMGLGLLRRRRR